MQFLILTLTQEKRYELKVYIKEGDGEWEMYNIGRDYLGSITHIATSNGTLIEENSYDPWGRLRMPGTTTVYPLGSEPELMLGRGYTGHEHLTWFGVINMNARLYDPVLGRFLSPDPFVQIPDFTQNFNRYSYCLNNPLKFVDENGEIVLGTLITYFYDFFRTIFTGGVNLGNKNLYYR
jgi:RHS repeat-associated protein